MSVDLYRLPLVTHGRVYTYLYTFAEQRTPTTTVCNYTTVYTFFLWISFCATRSTTHDVMTPCMHACMCSRPACAQQQAIDVAFVQAASVYTVHLAASLQCGAIVISSYYGPSTLHLTYTPGVLLLLCYSVSYYNIILYDTSLYSSWWWPINSLKAKLRNSKAGGNY